MKITGGKPTKVFSGKGNIKIDIIMFPALVKCRVSGLDEFDVKKRSVSISTKNKVDVYMRSDENFTIDIYHNGKKKRF